MFHVNALDWTQAKCGSTKDSGVIYEICKCCSGSGENIRPQVMLEKLFLSYEQMTMLLEYNHLLASEWLDRRHADFVNLVDWIMVILLYNDSIQLQCTRGATFKVELSKEVIKVRLASSWKIPSRGWTGWLSAIVWQNPILEGRVNWKSLKPTYYSRKTGQILNTFK